MPIACPDCDLLVRASTPTPAVRLACPRCGATLRRPVDARLPWMLPLALAAAVVFVLANTLPFVRIEVAGMTTAATPVRAVEAVIAQGLPVVGLLVLATAVVVPGLQVVAQAVLGLALRWHRAVPLARGAVRLEGALRPWGMLEVLLLAVLVSLVRLGDVVPVVPGAGLWSFAALVLLNLAGSRCFDRLAFWAALPAAAARGRP